MIDSTDDNGIEKKLNFAFSHNDNLYKPPFILKLSLNYSFIGISFTSHLSFISIDSKVSDMGFRNMEAFNLALLARQGWQLITDPNYLLSRTLKAQYFPRTSFLKAKVGYEPSPRVQMELCPTSG